ncbi:high affinity immunoglobulin gamma Fc receptor I-like [Anabas testudineus]|uniref:Ig-like domain-containing protein n=1 Tax=Anabas testudineus TaxID=64144 RepID=A0AAQ6IKW5_ANATE|nr:high affinity immunoglobulin gamma Fc receptor I-like [Anabas testudineus]
MEATALHIRLFFNVLLMRDVLGCQHHHLKHDATFLQVLPSRLQFFEYETISLICEGFNVSAKWKGLSNTEEIIPICVNSTGTPTVNCTIYNVFEADSGVYWCESGLGERSNAVNITVTAGSVILESPALPVLEGEIVTLHCREEATAFNYIADFYKNGLLIHASYSGKMTIHNVSRADEGLYKCRIPEAGESAGSWLTVASSVILETPVHPVIEGEAATLHCRLKSSPAKFPAVFYKDGLFIGTSSTGNMSIHRVYMSHEGLYKCHISGVGESPQSWLTVRAFHTETCLDHFFYFFLLLKTASTVVLAALLLLLVGLYHCSQKCCAEKRPQGNSVCGFI